MKRYFSKVKIRAIVLVMSFTLVSFFSCKKFLQVQPRDYMFEEEVFSSKKGVESVLNGIYQSMSDSLLYGNVLTLTATEQMAQYYYAISGDFRNLFKDYTYSATKPLLAQVWSKSYQTILGINNFCGHLESPSFGIISTDEKNILLGETYALRAFIHFDMLRLYGPVYVTSSNDLAIPYIKKATSEAQPLLSATAVIDSILSDMEASIKLLEKDPVRSGGAHRIDIPSDGENINYLSNRHRRMNYFAVKTLKARILLYVGKKDEAYKVVKSILIEQEEFFPWQTEKQMATDPLLSQETYFGIENRNLYNFYRQLFSPLLDEEKIYTPKQPMLDALYNPASSDLRLRYWFKLGVEGNKNYQVFVKHSNVSLTDASIQYFQPLIRKAELYLIAAETSNDLEQGYFYLNSLRLSRGLPSLLYHANLTSADLLAEIRKAYQREFIGEGQTFFMFKRLNLATITPYTGRGKISMNKNKYVWLLPEDETYYR